MAGLLRLSGEHLMARAGRCGNATQWKDARGFTLKLISYNAIPFFEKNQWKGGRPTSCTSSVAGGAVPLEQRSVLMLAGFLRKWRQVATAACSLAVAFALSPTAEAAPVAQASFGIGGAFTLLPGTDLSSADALYIVNGGDVFVTQGDSGDLSALIDFGDRGTLANIPSLTNFTPITGYLTLDSGVSLDLLSLAVHQQSGPRPGFLDFSGAGVLHAPGFDVTNALVSWTGTTSDNMAFTLALHTSVMQVPEPIALTLLGLGLIGCAYVRRRKPGAVSAA